MSTPDDRVCDTADVLEQFRDHRRLTLDAVVDRSGVPESIARECLARLERAELLVECRGGTEVPVWKPR
ncbi:helix-turn-helix domain-containing protein [Salinigranum sp. GCM10025319]|uniref:helix-turn-helix domain-containing protein n=1 Tax=Salinigranum sp. GCM10025319 TaxID=3252687 RepID=UPI00361550E2